ncbi:hypothetical protein [Plantibacter sp. MMLR14_011]|uniref:hypothetical protein n=1 Tax=Plantibacter sp. MMLR14_011 TaxID=1898746 RepID=UPI0011139B46|nr:hypothetical protein [Plantibacter sp. MMLR14_011]
MPKFLDSSSALFLTVSFIALFVGIFFVAAAAARGGSVEIALEANQIRWLQLAYRYFLGLALLGYIFWVLIAISQGVRLDSLASVIERQAGAIGDLKADSRPVGGVTTLTQFGPLAVVLGYVLRKIGFGGRYYYWLFPLAGLRYMFYAERLALIEVLVPLIVIAALTTDHQTRGGRFIRWAPIFGAPALWTLFAISEYSRSWIFYEQTVGIGFPAWVSLRLLGYYTTSFNNSALFLLQTNSHDVVPYFTVSGFWNSPGIEQLLHHPGFSGLNPDAWWTSILYSNSNPEFTNTGSFLVVVGEFGPVLSIFYWLLLGMAIGATFRAMTRGSIPALIATAALFISILELPRIMYWSLGRSVPVILGILILALWFPRNTGGPRGTHSKGAASRVASRAGDGMPS